MRIDKSRQGYEEDFYIEEEEHEDDTEIIDLSERRRKTPKRKRKLSVKTLAVLFVILLALAGLLFSPLFSIKTISISEMQHYTKGEICEMIGLSEGMNLFAFQKGKAEKLLLADNFVESATIKRKLPDTIEISIKERKVRGYVPYMGSYLYIDEYGRVLTVESFYKDNLPVVEGLEFDRFQLGEILQVDNPDSFDVVVKMSQLIIKYNILESVVKIDVSDPKNIHAYVNKVDILLGDINNADEKISMLSEIIKKIPEEDRGTLDLRDMDKPIVFKYLT